MPPPPGAATGESDRMTIPNGVLSAPRTDGAEGAPLQTVPRPDTGAEDQTVRDAAEDRASAAAQLARTTQSMLDRLALDAHAADIPSHRTGSDD